MKKIWGGTREGSKAIFSKELKRTITHLRFLRYSFTSKAQKTFVNLEFLNPMTKFFCSIWLIN
jgi:hypothetical protein